MPHVLSPQGPNNTCFSPDRFQTGRGPASSPVLLAVRCRKRRGGIGQVGDGQSQESDFGERSRSTITMKVIFSAGSRLVS